MNGGVDLEDTRVMDSTSIRFARAVSARAMGRTSLALRGALRGLREERALAAG